MKIYVGRLKNGQVEKIEEQISSHFLDIHEEDLTFPETLHLWGQAYLTNEHLFFELFAETTVDLPCSICNEPTTFPLKVTDCAHAIPFEEIDSDSFDYTEILREAILLLVPPFLECQNGKCPERENVNKFLKKSAEKTFPFADIDKNS